MPEENCSSNPLLSDFHIFHIQYSKSTSGLQFLSQLAQELRCEVWFITAPSATTVMQSPFAVLQILNMCHGQNLSEQCLKLYYIWVWLKLGYRNLGWLNRLNAATWLMTPKCKRSLCHRLWLEVTYAVWGLASMTIMTIKLSKHRWPRRLQYCCMHVTFLCFWNLKIYMFV